jgi:predicted Zn-dependent protease
MLWRTMAVAYGRDDQIGMASVALAELAVLEGRNDDARDQARRAQKLLPNGSRGFLMAQDIESGALRAGRDSRN